jgi:hypothetical protein
MPKMAIAMGGAWILGSSQDTDARVALTLLVLAYLAVICSNLVQLRRLRQMARLQSFWIKSTPP